MDDNSTQNDPTPPSPPLPLDRVGESERQRDRLLASLILLGGAGLLLALPFALQAGAKFFLPLTAAVVIAIALVPLLEWLERRRLPAPVAAFVCIALFLTAANIAIVAIIVPAWGWVRILPERIGKIQATVRPLIDYYAQLESFVNKLISDMATAPAAQASATSAPPPNSLIDLFTGSAPSALLEMFFALLVIYFFLAGWTRLRRSIITARSSFGGAMTIARVIQDVVDDTSAYLGTITIINLLLGSVIALCLWLMGMPTPLMWGGIVALLNFVPYLGPVVAAGLLALGGMIAFDDLFWAMLPPAIMIAGHLIEANVITPTIVGHRLTINPLMILISLSFWGWVWGTTGALLAVPLLIIIQTVLNASGRPDIAGFLFEQGTLLRDSKTRGDAG